MKKFIPLLLAAGILMLGACKEKKQNEEIIATKYIPKKPGAPVRMADKTETDNATWMGERYEITVSRCASDSLPMVSNEIGQKFVDNRIRLSIRRTDGSAFFDKWFSKASFTSYLPADYRKNGLLTDMRFKEVDGAELELMVAIAEPEATEDEFLPLKLTITRDGGIAIKVEDDLDIRLNPDEIDEE